MLKKIQKIFKRKQTHLSAIDSTNNTDENFNEDKHPIRFGTLFLLIGLGGFLLWAFFAPLDEGVPCQGSISIDTKRKIIQHLSGGVIKNIYVKEGQFVKANDVLLTFSDTTVKARLEDTRQHYFGLRAAEDRILAEQVHASEIKFHPDLMQFSNDPLVLQHIQNQKKLLLGKRGNLNAELQGIEESIKGQEAQIQGLKISIQTRKAQMTILESQLTNIRQLVKEGFAPLNQQQDLELKLSSLLGEISDAESNIIKSEKGINELRQRFIARKEMYQKELESEQAQVIVDVDASAQKLKALNEEFEKLEVRSPVDGQAIGLQFQTVGAVVQPGQRILDIVPRDEELVLEAKIPPNLIDQIKVGQIADLRFMNFVHTPQLMVEGKLKSISKDLLTDPASNPNQATNSYYLARIVVTEDGIKKLGGRVLQPGMPVEIVISTGERSMLKYLLGPFIKRVSQSMTEQ